MADGPPTFAAQFECAGSQECNQKGHLRVLCVSAVRRMALVAHYLSSYKPGIKKDEIKIEIGKVEAVLRGAPSVCDMPMMSS